MQVASFLKRIHKHILCTMTIEQHIKFVALTILSTHQHRIVLFIVTDLTVSRVPEVCTFNLPKKWRYPKYSSVYEASTAYSRIQYST